MKRVNLFALILSTLLLILSVGMTVLLFSFKTTIGSGQDVPLYLAYLAAGGILVSMSIHAFILIFVVVQFRRLPEANLLKAGVYSLAAYSLFLSFVDVIMLREIGNEYRVFTDLSGEWTILFVNHAFHILFALLSTLYCAFSLKQRKTDMEKQPAVKDEAVFLSVNQVGVVSAVLGGLSLSFWSGFGTPERMILSLAFFISIVILIPYLLSLGYWFSTKRREKPADWIDEKQLVDVSRSALITLGLCGLTTIGLFACVTFEFASALTRLALPILIFFGLLLFSGFTLYFSHSS